jgi:acetyl-CoA carboxylase carboxyl transferase subunit beta
MGLFSRNKPKIKVQTTKKDGFSGWVKCSSCSELIHANELQQNLNCCPKCDHHYRISVKQRIALLSDKDTFKPMFENIHPVDPLNFEDVETYSERIKKAKEKSNNSEAITVGICKLDGKYIAIGVLDFSFMGGSMGSVVGEKIALIAEHAIEKKFPLILVSASGGARMQESILSLMQMAKTSAVIAKLHDQKIPYISVLTNPTMGGVTASFASLGDVVIAEPDALIGFAGPRVVEQITKQKLPSNAQKAEFLLEHGMIDCIVRRSEIKEKIALLLEYLDYSDFNLLAQKEAKRLKQLVKHAQGIENNETISKNTSTN